MPSGMVTEPPVPTYRMHPSSFEAISTVTGAVLVRSKVRVEMMIAPVMSCVTERPESSTGNR